MAADVRIDQVLTFGMEEEFLLADMKTRVAAPRAADVVVKAGAQLGECAQQEFYATQVEFTTQPHTTLEALRADLLRGRSIGATAAASTGCLLVASASAVLTEHPLRILASNPRYATMARRFADVVQGIHGENSGCHLHLGTLERHEVLDLSNHLRPWLPVLQALCVNSPFAAGRDRGCASWRHFEARAWPTTGPTPWLDQRTYERLATGLVDTGTIMDRKMVYWYARPSEHCPTLEIRVADVNPDLDIVMLYAALLRGLGTTLMAEIRLGRPSPEISETVLWTAHQNVAQSGLAGSVLDPVTRTWVPAGRLLDDLVERSRPGLAAAGDEEAVDRLLGRLREQGTAADRQRATWRRRGRLRDVVDSLAVGLSDC